MCTAFADASKSERPTCMSPPRIGMATFFSKQEHHYSHSKRRGTGSASYTEVIPTYCTQYGYKAKASCGISLTAKWVQPHFHGSVWDSLQALLKTVGARSCIPPHFGIKDKRGGKDPIAWTTESPPLGWTTDSWAECSLTSMWDQRSALCEVALVGITHTV